MLHVSERTLQRYAKNNGVFALSMAERAVQLHMITTCQRIFGDVPKFTLIKRNPYMLEGNLSIHH